MPAQGKRSWDSSDDNEKNTSKDYPVCDQCRSRKIRCGRERPQCSNCTRLGLECEWLGQGKKPNQTIWLSHAVTRLGDRLEQLESAVSGLQSSLDKSDTASFDATTPPIQSENFSRGRRCSIRNVSGHERYYGSTSFVSLMQDIAAIIEADLCNVEQNAPEVVANASIARGEILRLTEPYDTYNRVSDGSVLTSPPLVIIEAMIDPYFEMVDPYMPLWTKEGFRKLMATMEHCLDASDKRAYDVCANNLVLLTLQAKFIHTRASSSITGTATPRTSSIDMDLIKSFIINAKRALENVELLLLSPSLLSLQALLSLCFVSQTSLSEDVTALLFSFAIHVAKAIGLHQWASSNYGEATAQNDSIEKRNAMYCMLCLSRSVSWSSGGSYPLPGMSAFERELSSFSNEASYSLGARVSLLQLEELVYTGLYSDEATQLDAKDMGKKAVNRGRKLQDWAAEHGDDLAEDQGCRTPLDCARSELAIRLHSNQVLATWPIAEDLEASCSLLDVARRSLRLLRHLWQATSVKSHYLNLSLLVASYPPVAFFELAKHVLCNSQVSSDDMDLLQFFVNMVNLFAEWAEEDAYISKLSRFGVIMWRLMDTCRISGMMQPGSLPAQPNLAGQPLMNPVDSYQGIITPTAQMYGAGSVASSSSHTNSTPISGRVQQALPITTAEALPLPTTTTLSTSVSSISSFDEVFGGEISPMEELDGWLIDSGPQAALRGTFRPHTMANLNLECNNAYMFEGIEFG